MGALVSRGAVVSTTTPHVIFRLVVRGLGTVLVVAGVCFISAEAIFFSGISAYGRSEFATAYERVQLARKLDPINAYFDWYAGYTTLFYKQDPALVDAVMNRLKRLHSSFGMTYNQTGNLNFLLYKKTGDRKYLTRAIEDFRQLTIRDPLASESYIYLYYFSDIAGDRTQAVQALRYSIVTNPEDVRTWMLLAKQYQSQGDRKRTSFTLEKAFALKPDIPAVKQAWFSMKNGTPLAQVDIPILVQFSGLQ
jgi:tetratricopeptide (TPR) repeat protein